MKNRLFVVITAALMLFGMGSIVQGGTQVLEGNTVNITPDSYFAGGTAAWAIDPSSWNYDNQLKTQFASEVYSRNDQYVNQWQRINTQQTNSGPGLVYHFQSDVAVSMDLLINLNYSNGNWGGHSFEVYFSDENDFANLSPMTGGRWAGAGDVHETNPAWTSLYYHSLWGSDGGHSLSLPAYTEDGDFYVRFDMTLTDGVGQGFQNVSAFGVSGTVVPETDPEHEIDFSPVTGWSLPVDSWIDDGTWRTEFTDEIYHYNLKYATIDQQIGLLFPEASPGTGGLVWHFTTDHPVDMTVTVDPNYIFNLASTGGRGIDVYFSDGSPSIAGMTGGAWGDAVDTNWTLLHSDRDDTGAAASVPAEGALTAASSDGDFWVRIDMMTEDDPCDDLTAVRLIALDVSAEVAMPPIDPAERVQVFENNTIDFSPVNGRDCFWSLDNSGWAEDGAPRREFTDEIYCYNDNIVTADQAITTAWIEEGSPGIGGMVWHFQVADPCWVASKGGVKLDILAHYAFPVGINNGHVFDIYYSDNNDWNDLYIDFSTMYPAWNHVGLSGGVWGGPSGDPPTGWTGIEYNPEWKRIYNGRQWGGQGTDITLEPGDALPEDANEIISTDGDFWVRVDVCQWDQAIFDNYANEIYDTVMGYIEVYDVTVQGVIQSPVICEDVWEDGVGMALDLNQDCEINLPDMAILSSNWLRCNDPQRDDCEATNW